MVDKEVRKIHVVHVGAMQEGCGVGGFGWDAIVNVDYPASVCPIVNVLGKSDYREKLQRVYDDVRKGTLRDYIDAVNGSFVSSERREVDPSYKLRHIREIKRGDLDSYVTVAKSIVSCAKQRHEKDGTLTGVIGQHENGLYALDYETDDFYTPMLSIFRENNIPVLSILHTVELSHEDPKIEAHLDEVLKNIVNDSSKSVCISKSVIQGMIDKYGVHRGSMIHIPHGVPEAYVSDSIEEIRGRYRFCPDDTIFTCFGHLSSGKGLEYVIKGFSGVVNGQHIGQRPKLFVAGGTHPNVLEKEGEIYRESLERLVRNPKLNLTGAIVDKNDNIVDMHGKELDSLDDVDVVFLNRPLTDEEIPEIINMSDVGVVGNLKQQQYSSGPGSLWTGLGKPIIATESVFFRDLQSQGIGLLVPFRNSAAFTERMNFYLGLSQSAKDDLAFNASDKGAIMAWSVVGLQYQNLMRNLIMQNVKRGKFPGIAA